jgi:hypothetical protein
MAISTGAGCSLRRNLRKALFSAAIAVTAFVLPTAVAGPASGAQTLAAFTTWVNNHNGTCVGGTQCVNLVNAYGNWAGAASISGNAIDFYTNAAGVSGWSRWALGAHTPARADVAVYNSGLSGRAQGHVAIILENVDANTFRVYHQNWNRADHCSEKSLLPRGASIQNGYIRPPVS